METKNNFAMPVAIVLAGIIIAGAIYFNDGKKADTAVVAKSNPFGQAQTVNIKNVKVLGEPFIGDPNAKVTIAYWFDYQCPACKYNEENLMTSLVADYVKTGKVKVVFKDFAFLGLPQIVDSNTLGVTARAVWEAYPDKFYAWHKMIYDNQGQESTGWATKEVIATITQKVAGIDMAVIDKLIAQNGAKYQKAMDDDKAEGGSFGVNATPSFIVNDQLIVGVPQYVQLKAYIDNLLK
jgi:protein-disulfide isomerase